MAKVNNLSASLITKGVISYLKKHNQLSLLSVIAKETTKLSRASYDPNTVFITSAIELAPEIKNDLSDTISKSFGRELAFTFNVDKEIIGGLVIKVGDMVINQSLAHRINQIGKAIKL